MILFAAYTAAGAPSAFQWPNNSQKLLISVGESRSP